MPGGYVLSISRDQDDPRQVMDHLAFLARESLYPSSKRGGTRLQRDCIIRKSSSLSVKVFITNQLQTFSPDFVHSLFDSRLIGRKCTIVLI